jgi:hypothetical protein
MRTSCSKAPVPVAREGRMGHVEQLGPEHHREASRPFHRAGDVRARRGGEPRGRTAARRHRGRGLVHGGFEIPEAARGHLGEQRGERLVVAQRRAVRHARAPRDLAHREPAEALLLEQLVDHGDEPLAKRLDGAAGRASRRHGDSVYRFVDSVNIEVRATLMVRT